MSSEVQDYENLELVITDLTGREIKRIQSDETNRIHLERNGLISGVYFYQIFSDGQLLDNGKIIAQ